MAIAGFGFNVLEQILVRLEVKDIIQCKRVCKSWYSLNSSNSFVKYQLNHSCNNDLKLLGHRRVARPIKKIPAHDFHCYLAYGIVGSSNGLVCQIVDYILIVTNPAEHKWVLLPRLPYEWWYCRESCFGYGYDPYIDDYKIIAAGVPKERPRKERRGVPTSFHVFMLKASPAAWRLIGPVNYGHTENGRSGVLCDGALHWFMTSYENDRKVILSLDLSTEEFREIPQPELDEYECNDDHRLGVVQGCLCIYNHKSSFSNKWLYNKQQSWELIPWDYQIEHVVHYLRTPGDYVPMDPRFHGICFSKARNFIDAHIYVQSLVSPHAINNNNNNNMGRRRQLTKNKVRPTRTQNNKRRAKGRSSRYVYPKRFLFSRTIYEGKRMR